MYIRRLEKSSLIGPLLAATVAALTASGVMNSVSGWSFSTKDDTSVPPSEISSRGFSNVNPAAALPSRDHDRSQFGSKRDIRFAILPITSETLAQHTDVVTL